MKYDSSYFALVQVFTLMTKNEMVSRATSIITQKFPKASLSYSVGGTLKFDLPADSVAHSDVFEFVETIKQRDLFEVGSCQGVSFYWPSRLGDTLCKMASGLL